MRHFELAMIILLSLTWLSYFFSVSKRSLWQLLLPALAFLATLAQFLIEHYRWQMVPAYCIVVLLCLVGSLRYFRRPADAPPAKPKRIVLKILGIVLSLAGLVIIAALPVLLPVFRLPEPAGPYAVGVTAFEWVDASRPESYSPDPDDYRDLFVQVWYPADDVAGAKRLSPWGAIKGSDPALHHLLGFPLPDFFFNHLKLVKAHSYWDAPLSSAQETYPVLIFSHGYGVTLDQNTVQMEEHASHGYIIFSIAHPYDSFDVTYPDGRVVFMRQEIWNPPDMAAYLEIRLLWNRYMVEMDWVKKEQLLDEYYVRSGDRETLALWVEDTVFVLDEIERLNRGEIPGPFAGRLNLGQLGLLGHSFGGTTAGEACSYDDRHKPLPPGLL